MSVADLYDLELIWPASGPKDVIVTGTFDQWSSSIRLAKGDAGFSGTVQVPWGQKIEYKFIVDGDWQCRADRPQEEDGNGNTNNVLQTPPKPEPAAVHNPPVRLSIPLAGAPSEGYSAVENMVTAVEFIPPAESAVTRGSLPLLIPQITVEGLSQGPSSANGSRLNTAAATEGDTSPASVTPAEVAPPKQAPFSQTIPILLLSDDGSVPLPAINGNGQPSQDITTHAPIQFIKGELASRSVPENGGEVAVIPESAAPQPTAQLDEPPVAIVDSIEKQLEVDPPDSATQGHHQQVATPLTISTASTPASSTVTQKKRRSLLSRIKHIFEKNKDKQERKEKTKH